MLISDIIIESQSSSIYSIGDSHAVAIARAGNFQNLATNGRSAFSADNDRALQSLRPNSTVVLSAGANDMTNSNLVTVALRVRDLLETLLDQGHRTYYVLFAATDHAQFSRSRNRLRSLVSRVIPSAVHILDMGSLSVRQGDGIHAPPSWYAQASATVRSNLR